MTKIIFSVVATILIALIVGLIIWAMGHVVSSMSPSVLTKDGDENNDHPLSKADMEYVERLEKKSPMYARLYWAFVGLMFVIFLTGGLSLVGYVFTIDFSQMGKNTWEKVLFLVISLAIYLSIATPFLRGCIQKVEPDEIALLKVLGFPVKVCDPGPVAVFFDGRFMSLQRQSTPTNQVQYPAETADITYADEGTEPEGKKQLLRVTLLGPEGSDPGDDPWKQRRTIGIGFTLSLMPDTNHPFTFGSRLAKS